MLRKNGVRASQNYLFHAATAYESEGTNFKSCTEFFLLWGSSSLSTIDFMKIHFLYELSLISEVETFSNKHYIGKELKFYVFIFLIDPSVFPKLKTQNQLKKKEQRMSFILKTKACSTLNCY